MLLNDLLTFLVGIWSDTRLTTFSELLKHMHKTHTYNSTPTPILSFLRHQLSPSIIAQASSICPARIRQSG